MNQVHGSSGEVIPVREVSVKVPVPVKLVSRFWLLADQASARGDEKLASAFHSLARMDDAQRRAA